MEAFLNYSNEPGHALLAVAPIPACAKARESGVNVVLDGVDGDLVTSAGSIYIKFLIRQGRLWSALREARGWGNFYRGMGSEFTGVAVFCQNLRAALAPDWLRGLAAPIRRSRQKKLFQEYDDVLSPEFARRLDLNSLIDRQQRDSSARSLAAYCISAVREAETLDVMEWYDAAASYSSVEARRPFYDKRFVEFCLRLPWNQRIRGGFSKHLLRRAYRSEIPESLLVRRNFEHVGPAFSRAWIEDAWPRIEPDVVAKELTPYFSETFVRSQFHAFQTGDRGDTTRQNIFSLLALGKWLKNIVSV